MTSSEPGIDWAETLFLPGPGGSVNVVYCYSFEGDGRVCSRCGVLKDEHVEPTDDE